MWQLDLNLRVAHQGASNFSFSSFGFFRKNSQGLVYVTWLTQGAVIQKDQ